MLNINKFVIDSLHYTYIGTNNVVWKIKDTYKVRVPVKCLAVKRLG